MTIRELLRKNVKSEHEVVETLDNICQDQFYEGFSDYPAKVITKACTYVRGDFEEIAISTSLKSINDWNGNFEAQKIKFCEKLTPSCKDVDPTRIKRDSYYEYTDEAAKDSGRQTGQVVYTTDEDAMKHH